MSQSTGAGLGSKLMEDMLESGIIIKSPSKHGKGTKELSQEDRAKIEDMVKGLSKFRHMEEDFDDDAETRKKSKFIGKKVSSGKPTKDEKMYNVCDSLSDYVNAELSVLTSSVSVPVVQVSDEFKENVDNTSGRPESEKKSSARVGSVSAEMQEEFLLLQEQHAEKNKQVVEKFSSENCSVDNKPKLVIPEFNNLKDSTEEKKKKKKNKKDKGTPPKGISFIHLPGWKKCLSIYHDEWIFRQD